MNMDKMKELAKECIELGMFEEAKKVVSEMAVPYDVVKNKVLGDKAKQKAIFDKIISVLEEAIDTEIKNENYTVDDLGVDSEAFRMEIQVDVTPILEQHGITNYFSKWNDQGLSLKQDIEYFLAKKYQDVGYDEVEVSISKTPETGKFELFFVAVVE